MLLVSGDDFDVDKVAVASLSVGLGDAVVVLETSDIELSILPGTRLEVPKLPAVLVECVSSL